MLMPRFRIMKDFLGLRPVFHRLEERVRAHIAVCVMAAVIEAVMAEHLTRAGVMDPEIPEQVMTPRRALVELSHIEGTISTRPGTTSNSSTGPPPTNGPSWRPWPSTPPTGSGLPSADQGFRDGCGGNTFSSRPVYQDLRETPAEVGPENRTAHAEPCGDS